MRPAPRALRLVATRSFSAQSPTIDPAASQAGNLTLASLDAQIAAVERRNRHLERAVAPAPAAETSKWKLPETYAATRRHLDFALSLNPAAYHDLAYFQAEVEQLWEKKWFAVEHVQAFKRHGDTQVVDVGKNSYVVTMDRHGELHAFHNVCRHRGSKLCTSGGNKKRINCPYHHWSYNLKGELVGTPFFDQPHFDRKLNSLFPVRVEVFAGLVWLCADMGVRPLREQLGASTGLQQVDRFPFRDMDVVGAKDYHVNCDWKLLAENFLEYYHLNAVHPELAEYSTPEQHKGNQFPGNYVGYCTNPVTDSGSCVDLTEFHPNPGGEVLDTEDYRAFETAYFYQFFPNVSVSVFPNFVYSLICLPAGPGKTVEKMTVLQHRGSKLDSDSDEKYNAKVAEVMKFVSMVNQQDVDICERVGLGVSQAAYPGGVFSPSMEGTVYRFQNLVIDAMTGADPGPYPRVMVDYDNTMTRR
mmetsp:Transcript_11231/g.24790  ORF Transcript_11231/g.24790 Transcript_11231/m.24790 type:complete len:471 (+) Transcript_11231:41-1453(+)